MFQQHGSTHPWPTREHHHSVLWVPHDSEGACTCHNLHQPLHLCMPPRTVMKPPMIDKNLKGLPAPPSWTTTSPTSQAELSNSLTLRYLHRSGLQFISLLCCTYCFTVGGLLELLRRKLYALEVAVVDQFFVVFVYRVGKRAEHGRIPRLIQKPMQGNTCDSFLRFRPIC